MGDTGKRVHRFAFYRLGIADPAGKTRFCMDHDERSLGSELRSATDLELAGRLEEAAEIYQRLADDHPTSWTVRQRYARLSWNRQRREQAFALLDEALAIAPEQPALHAELLAVLGRR